MERTLFSLCIRARLSRSTTCAAANKLSSPAIFASRRESSSRRACRVASLAPCNKQERGQRGVSRCVFVCVYMCVRVLGTGRWRGPSVRCICAHGSPEAQLARRPTSSPPPRSSPPNATIRLGGPAAWLRWPPARNMKGDRGGVSRFVGTVGSRVERVHIAKENGLRRQQLDRAGLMSCMHNARMITPQTHPH